MRIGRRSYPSGRKVAAGASGRGSVCFTRHPPVAIVARTCSTAREGSCGRGGPDRPEPALDRAWVPPEPALGIVRTRRRFVHWPIPIVGSPVSTAAWSSSSPRVSRSSMRSAGSRRHPSGVLRVAHPARHSARQGGPALVQARTGGTGSHRAATAGTPSAAPGRCTRRSAPSVDGPPRCRSSPPALGRSTAATASRASAEVAFAVRGPRVARGGRTAPIVDISRDRPPIGG